MNIKSITTPVLFLCFNRPEKTKEVFDSIRKVRPTKLYVAIDAPREGRQDDVLNNNAVKEIVHNVDWPCEAHYLEQKKNLGCSLSGYTAWKWIMETENRMIFIEDDGFGNESAFYFMQELLDKYENDSRVGYIGGVNYGPTNGTASYFFSRIPSATYFMGTWKRVIDKYEYEIESFREERWKKKFSRNSKSLMRYLLLCGECSSYVKSIRNGNRINTYDIQMSYLLNKYGMYSIYPNINMVSNIGLDNGANNHCSVDSEFYKEYGNRKRNQIDVIINPPTVEIDEKFEASFFIKRYLNNDCSLRTLLRIIKKYLVNLWI